MKAAAFGWDPKGEREHLQGKKILGEKSQKKQLV